MSIPARALIAGLPSRWHRMTSGAPCVASMGEPAWAMETRFATIQGRWQHRHDLDAHLGQWTATHDAQALMHLLQAHGVPAGTVHRARPGGGPTPARTGLSGGFYQPQRLVGPRVYAGRPFRTLPDAPLALHLVSALGQHNVEILRDVAALSEAEIQGLVEAECWRRSRGTPPDPRLGPQPTRPATCGAIRTTGRRCRRWLTPRTSRPATASLRGKEVTVLGLLDDVQVVELTHSLAGAFCAKLLADQGAPTLKLNPRARRCSAP